MTANPDLDLNLLTETEQAEYLALLEAERRFNVRLNIREFATAMPIPGTPPVLQESDIPSETLLWAAEKIGDRKGWKQAMNAARERIRLEAKADISDDEMKVYYPNTLQPARHHNLIMHYAQCLIDEIPVDGHVLDGVMVMAPPGSAKSTYTSVVLPPWAMGRHSNYNVIATSYAQELAERFGRRVRMIARSREYEEAMDVSIRRDNAAVSSWSLSNGSDYRAAGVLGGVTGFRADLLILDDIIKNREEADSELIRDKVWDAIKDDLFTRLKPGGKILWIGTRWHQDDPQGRWLGSDWKGQSGLWETTDGMVIYIINLPILAEHDDDLLGRKKLSIEDRLWPEWYKSEFVARLQRNANRSPGDQRTWSALYQQRPTTGEGQIIRRSTWREWKDPELPEFDTILASWDTALTEEDLKINAYSACSIWGVFKHKMTNLAGEEFSGKYQIMLLAAARGHFSINDLFKKAREVQRRFRCNRQIIENKASGKSLHQEMVRARLPSTLWEYKGPAGAKGKVPRAHAAAYLFDHRSVWHVPDNGVYPLPDDTPVEREPPIAVGDNINLLISEVTEFPHGKHMDWVDTVTQIVIWLRDHWMIAVGTDEMEPDERVQFEEEQWGRVSRSRSLYGNRQAAAEAARRDLDAQLRKMQPDALKRKDDPLAWDSDDDPEISRPRRKYGG